MLTRILLVTGMLAVVAPAQDATLGPVSQERVSMLIQQASHTLLPAGAHVTITPHQQFTLSSPGLSALKVVPLLYTYYPTSQKQTEPDVCGVLFQDSEGPAYFVPTVGSFALPLSMQDNCQGALAMGKSAEGGSHPRLIAVFRAVSGHADTYSLSILLTWSPATHKYVLDAKTSDWLGNQQHADTVAQVRRLLKTHP